MSKVLIDGIANLSLHNGIVRVECVAVGADGQGHPSGTLMIPASMAATVLNSLIQGVQELDKKIREQVEAPEADK